MVEIIVRETLSKNEFVGVALKKMNTHHFYDDKGASLEPMNIQNVLPYMKKYVELNLI